MNEALTAFTFLTPVHLALVPIVIGLVEAIKKVGLPDRWAPIVSIALGLGGAWLIGGTALAIVLSGLVIGLSASGLYSGTSAVRNG